MVQFVAANFYPADTGMSNKEMETFLEEIGGRKILITGTGGQYIQALLYPDTADEIARQATERGLRVTRLNNRGNPKK